MTGPKRDLNNVRMSTLLSASRSSSLEIEAERIAMRLQRPTEPSLGLPHPLSQQLPAGGARTSRATHFNGESAPEETSALNKHVKAEQTRGKTPPRSPSKGGKGSGKAVKAKRRRTLLGSLFVLP